MNGIICIYKERGYTSFDVVAIMRKLCGTKKIGHGGTLDPMAEGVLPIFVGNATKAVDFCPDTTKEYRAEMRFGLTTDTQDITGKIIATSDIEVRRNTQYLLEQKFKGELLQTPPMYSAVQVNGQRLYDLARQGVEVERKARPITIHSLRFEEFGDNKATALISCSKGTYIRTIIHDMGVETGAGATMTALTRTRSGCFTLKDCYRLGQIKEVFEKEGHAGVEKLLMPVEWIYKGLPRALLDGEQTRLFLNGVVLDANRVAFDEDDGYDGLYRIVGHDGRFLAIGQIEADNSLKSVQRFNILQAKSEDKNQQEEPREHDNLRDISELKGVRLS